MEFSLWSRVLDLHDLEEKKNKKRPQLVNMNIDKMSCGFALIIPFIVVSIFNTNVTFYLFILVFCFFLIERKQPT